MDMVLSFAIKSYAKLLRLYPSRYRQEFEEQMLLDFTDMARDASNQGQRSLIRFLLRELFDFPISLVYLHLREGGILTALHSQPAKLAWRSALVFGLALGFSVLADGLALWIEPISDNFIPGWQQDISIGLMLDWAGFVLAGLAFGLLFAGLFGDRSRFSHYMLVGTLGWLLQFSVCNFLKYFSNYWVLLNVQENLYLYNLRLILSGAMFGLVLALAKSERREPLRALAVCVIAYPLLTYLYLRQVFDSFIFDSPWRLAVLAIFWLVPLGVIFAIARKCESDLEMTRIVITGALGSIVLRIIVLRVAFLFTPSVLPEDFLYDPLAFWSIVLILMAAYIVFGILFGFLLGWILGMQRENPSEPVVA